ncbi:hypothetical protein VTL71DRAFT_13286 [Oculimacula yallundae]|uniref:Heterokaryon incompatibility domain-containing protein n=1 Tax=Oculimacula yallundae TaxID=86028 RepID=A0ABR4CK23_9HELO
MSPALFNTAKRWLRSKAENSTKKGIIDVSETTSDGRYLMIENRIQTGDISVCQKIDASTLLTDSDCIQFEINTESENICNLCRYTFSVKSLRHLNIEGGCFIHHSMLQISGCANRGCLFCAFLQARRSTHPVFEDTQTQLLISQREGQLWVTYLDKLLDRGYCDPSECFNIFSSDGTHDGEFVFLRCLPNLDDTNETATMKIREWISICQKKHKKCPGQKIPRLPGRVINVDQMRLHISHSGEKAPYAALSYCWGGNQSFKATKDNLTSMIRALPYSSLPKTLQDAVFVTRQAGLRYLWVDALCILQDDELDKAFWVHKMDSIYTDCTVCIAAAIATGASEGFLRPRPFPDALKMPFDLEKDNKEHLWVVEEATGSYPPEPLHTRGWTFQEISLAQRVLMYSREGLTWTCAENFAPVPDIYLINEHSTRPTNVHPGMFHRREFPLGRPEILGSWKTTVHTFTKRELSFASDRLPALAGVAARFHSIRKDEYLAGLWREDLHLQLAWVRAQNDDNPSLQPTEYQAPSWTWSSVTGSVRYLESYMIRYHSHAIDIVSCRVQLITDASPFGKVKGGFWKLMHTHFP